MDTFQCVPNLSTSSKSLLEEMTEAAGEYARVLDYSCDRDHNRSVITMTGDAEELVPALVCLAQLATEHIDLNEHTGVHPRIGALDVVPVVPLFDTPMDSAVELSYRIGEALWSIGLPVYFYEESARTKAYRFLEDIRRGGYEWLKDHVDERKPDLGTRLHETAGAAVVGARQPLIAFNVNLDTDDADIAKTIAAEIRTLRRKHDKRLTGVKAIGLHLRSSDTVQVSTNITRPAQTGVYPVFNYIKERAEDLGCQVKNSELIGVIAEDIAAKVVKDSLMLDVFGTERIIREPEK